MWRAAAIGALLKLSWSIALTLKYSTLNFYLGGVVERNESKLIGNGFEAVSQSSPRRGSMPHLL
jgi:hypothetical protein